jgi:predicted RNase H-like HicB family nuclease
MNRLFYPALFHKAEEGGYWISFPNFPECLTQGETMYEAYNMAVDALGLCLTDMEREHIAFPEPSDVSSISIEDETTIVIIEFDMLAYKKRTNSKAVKKTLTIPEWLNEEATASGINFSQVLQEALMVKLGKAN